MKSEDTEALTLSPWR